VLKVVVGTVGLVGTVASAGLSATTRTHDADLTGKWRMTLEMEVGRATPLLELVEKEGKLSGTYTGRYGSSPVDGTVKGRTLAFTVALETTQLAFRGEIKDDGTLAGRATFGELGEVTWTAAREK
jgi:hypothetical protein